MSTKNQSGHYEAKRERPQLQFAPSNPNGRWVRYEHIKPGQYFRIAAEPSRGIRTSDDKRIYQRAYEGFYSFHVSSPAVAVLLPQDLVIPYKLARM